jgi:hypothetical protein
MKNNLYQDAIFFYNVASVLKSFMGTSKISAKSYFEALCMEFHSGYRYAERGARVTNPRQGSRTPKKSSF